MLRLIDGRGKLFGKINIIDFLVILFLLSIVPVFYLGYRLVIMPKAKVDSWLDAMQRERVLSQRFTPLELEVILEPIRAKKLKLISGGDILFDNAGKRVGAVLTVNRPNRRILDNKQILVKIMLLCEIKDDCLFYENKRLDVGSKIYLRAYKYIIGATVKSWLKLCFFAK